MSDTIEDRMGYMMFCAQFAEPVPDTDKLWAALREEVREVFRHQAAGARAGYVAAVYDEEAARQAPPERPKPDLRVVK